MKTYKIKKVVHADSIADAISKEKKVSVEYIAMVEDEEEEEEEFEEGYKYVGFNARRK